MDDFDKDDQDGPDQIGSDDGEFTQIAVTTVTVVETLEKTRGEEGRDALKRMLKHLDNMAATLVQWRTRGLEREFNGRAH